MTAICIDYFKNALYIFGDGMVSGSDGTIHHTNYRKIRELSPNVYVAITGDLTLFDAYVSVMGDIEPSLDLIAHLKGHGEGEIIYITKKTKKIIVCSISNEETVRVGNADIHARNSTITYEWENGPFFFGSGSAQMSGVYAAINPKRATTIEKYLEYMSKIYEAVASVNGSVSGLCTTEVLLEVNHE